MATPYVTPSQLITAPTGISWSTIPSVRSTPEAQLAEQTNICWRATDTVDSMCNQTLRATVNTEQLTGPDFRVTVDEQGVAHCLLSRWPVLEVIGACVCPASQFPRVWNTIPSGSIAPGPTITGEFGSAAGDNAGDGPFRIDLAPGYVTWVYGRNGYVVQLQYINGWPHASTTLNAQTVSGQTTMPVDDCTGFAGALVHVYDGMFTETASVASVSASTGPGTLTFTSPLVYAHTPNAVVSCLPAVVQEAAILCAVAEAITRGAAATTVQAMPGSTMNANGPNDFNMLLARASLLLDPYKRFI